MSVQVARRHFSIGEYERMVETGILREDDRVELIEGEILEMSPIGERHAACVRKVNRTLMRLVGDRSLVSVQSPIAIPEWSEPEPDVALLVPRADFYATGHPEPKHVQVLVEVADSSIDYDLTVKVPLYARAGVKETWVIDLRKREVIVFTNPRLGVYRTRRAFGRGETFETKRVPGLAVSTNDLLL